MAEPVVPKHARLSGNVIKMLEVSVEYDSDQYDDDDDYADEVICDGSDVDIHNFHEA